MSDVDSITNDWTTSSTDEKSIRPPVAVCAQSIEEIVATRRAQVVINSSVPDMHNFN